MTFGSAEKLTNLLRRPAKCDEKCIHFHTRYCPKNCSVKIAQEKDAKRAEEARLK